jgi:hypothetical protein
MRWCYASDSQLAVGDFNGDGHDDMLCYRKPSLHTPVSVAGEKWIAYAKQMPNGAWGFTGTEWHTF